MIGALGRLASALALLGTMGGLVVGLIALAYSLVARNAARARSIAVGMASGLSLYAAALVLVSLASRERSLGFDQERFFCGLDCDLAYSVVGVRTARALGPQAAASRAHGVYHVVSVRVRSDAAQARIDPNEPRAYVLSEGGRYFPVSSLGQGALERAESRSESWDQPLDPGASYTKDLVFDLPVGIRKPRLVISEGGWMTRLVIGDENSFLHRKTVFRLDDPPPSARSGV